MHIGESIEIEIINADEQVCSSPTCVKKLDPNPLKLSEKQKQQMKTIMLMIHQPEMGQKTQF